MADDRDEVVPLYEEAISVEKRRVEHGRVRVATRVSEHEEIVRQALEQEAVEVTRVRVDREVASRPEIRHEGDTTIIPVVEEVLVVERRLMVREEIHVRRTTRTVTVEQPVVLRSEEAIIERFEQPGEPGAGNDH